MVETLCKDTKYQIRSFVQSRENQKVLHINSGVFYVFSFGAAHPDPFFDYWERFQKVNKLQYGVKKGALYGQKSQKTRFLHPT